MTKKFAGFSLRSATIDEHRITKTYNAALSPDGFTRDTAAAMADDVALYMQRIKEAGIAIAESDVEVIQKGNAYNIQITSDFLGEKNVSDLLYEATTPQELIEPARLVAQELVHAYLYQPANLEYNELAFGFDSSPYNFVITERDGQARAHYVDFYPPRNRLDAQNERIESPITDLPQARDEQHHQNLLYNFYDREGMLLHSIGHLIAAGNSNPNIEQGGTLIQEAITDMLRDQGRDDIIEILDRESEKLEAFATRFENHRSFYYGRFTVDNPTIVLVANGLGTRLGDLTSNRPKSLVQVDGKPILGHILEDAMTVNPGKIIITVAPQSEQAFADYMEKNWPSIMYEIKPVALGGVGYSLHEIADSISPNEPLIVAMGDVITQGGFQQITNRIKHNQLGIGVTDAPICSKDMWSWGTLSEDGSINVTVKGRDEQTADDKALIGIYGIQTPELFLNTLSDGITRHKSGELNDMQAKEEGIINESGEYRLSPVLMKMLDQQEVSAELVDVPFALEINTRADLMSAERALRQQSLSRENRVRPFVF